MPQLHTHLYFAERCRSLFHYNIDDSTEYNEYLLGATIPDGIIRKKVNCFTVAFKRLTHFYIYNDLQVNPLPDLTAFIAKYGSVNILSIPLLQGYLTHLALDLINNLYWNHILTYNEQYGFILINENLFKVKYDDLLQYKWAGMNFMDSLLKVDKYPVYNDLTDAGINCIKDLGIYKTLCEAQPAQMEPLLPSKTSVESPINEEFCERIFHQTELYLIKLLDTLSVSSGDWDKVLL